MCTYIYSSKVSYNGQMLLTNIVKSQPHASSSAFTHALFNGPTYLSRTMANTSELLQPLEEVIHSHFLPAPTGCPPVSSMERKLPALPARMEGLSITNPVADTEHEFKSSS